MYAYVTGTPCSCMAAEYPSDTAGDMLSKPGKPALPLASLMTFPLRSVTGPLGLICGATDLLPKSPLNPVYPPGSSGSLSAWPPLAEEHSVLLCAQWMPIPTKSAVARVGFALTSAACGEFGPKTVGISVAMFSSTVFAVPTAPTLQPARVNGTQGAGAFFPSAVSMLYVVSVPVSVAGSNKGSVQ